MMTLYRFDIAIESAFATPPKGDTLFGQLCWLIVHRFGKDRLDALLEGYTGSRPFMIVSDFLIGDHFQLPPVPRWMIDDQMFDIGQRKQLKNRVMIDIGAFTANGYRLDAALLLHAKDKKKFTPYEDIQIRVKINRLTGTTGSGFDPFANIRYEYPENAQASFYIMVDHARLSYDELLILADTLSKTGFGKDATIGRGRFRVQDVTPVRWECANANAMITLSPCVLGCQGFADVFYEPFTRWGKHGDYLANSERVWKNPVLMADTFACVRAMPSPFVGIGITGVSAAIDTAVHQGYAIALPAHFEPRGIE